MKKILVTTTETLQGWEIVNYIEPIYSNLMVGANYFSDLGAAFTDIFGGRATRYEKRIQLLNEKAVEILKAKARGMGANCILGLRVDVDEVSGKNMQMFMITAWGTAVVAKNTINPLQVSNSKEFDKEKIQEQANIIRLAKASLKDDFKLTLKDLQIIVDSKSPEFKDILLKKYKSLDPVNFNSEDYKELVRLYTDYFSVLNLSDSIPLFYNDLLSETIDSNIEKVLELIKINDLLDYKFIELLLSSESKKRKIALTLLTNDKSSYGQEDMVWLKKMIELLKEAFPLKATFGLKKTFLSSKEKEVWNCTCGHANTMDYIYCDNCHKDKLGFKENELKPSSVITLLTNKLLALQTLLN